MAQHARKTPDAVQTLPATFITDYHAIARAALGEICAITRLALDALEQPSAYRHIDELAQVIECLHFASGGALDTLESELEMKGIALPECAADRRHQARLAAVAQERS